MSKKSILLLIGVFIISSTQIMAQSADDVLRYSLEYPSYDPVSLVTPAVSNATGFGAYQENPASMALFDESFLSMGLSSRFLDETGTYLGNTSNYSDNQTGIGDLGLVYKVPTTRGSLVVGGGYSQTTDFNRALSASGRNERSTITDFYNTTSDDSLFFAAFDAYAVDFATTDSSYAETSSIFRIGFPQYPGINQDFELTERGKTGEYSLFLATEFLENFYVGGSIGYYSGTYTYRREFLESDRQNDYNATFIDSDGDGNPDTDIDNILSEDRIDAEIQAFSARLGIIYEPIPDFRLAASYEFPSKLFIDEEFNTIITSTFDNTIQFSDDAPGAFSYTITRPQRIKAGLTFKGIPKLTLSGSAEVIAYSDAEIDFDELDLNPLENDINSTVRSAFTDVINLRGGLEYETNNSFTTRLGYAYFPSPQDGIDSERQFISGGFSAVLTKGLTFDFGLQYSFWDDQNALYSTPDVTEVVQEQVTRLNVMAGLRMTL
ncbi:OmpP1/FadL family transporter [Fodinibius sp.]|uniref:OmpP1/FadL family transporter n=1 Tax=Fodinibius sp. TaxID=1872440 RepID=UPI002ACDD0B1|nr:outer membrane protein transport protein [Fodinibius sp.]MDZ7659340.1 outer membrane protein transport protein [Fodinibius sp.]